MKNQKTIKLLFDLPNCPKGRIFKEDNNGDFFHSMTDDEAIQNKFKFYRFTKEEVAKNPNWFSKEVNNYDNESYESILKKKIEYYGKTEAAYAFAAENYATIKMIEENIKLLRIAEKHGNGKMEYEIHSRIEELERMIKK